MIERGYGNRVRENRDKEMGEREVGGEKRGKRGRMRGVLDSTVKVSIGVVLGS